MTYFFIKDDEMNDRKNNKPWFAIAFSAGHEQRLSPSCGGEYSGHTPPSPG
jgi:hypothetical protein